MPACSVAQCLNAAAYEVVLYQFCPDTGGVVFEPDTECPFLCSAHAVVNQRHAQGNAEYAVIGSGVSYPYTNKARINGYTIYLPIDQHESYDPLPKKVQAEALQKIGDYCTAKTEDLSDIGYRYSYRLFRNTITISVHQPGSTNEQITIPLARLRYEKPGEWRASQVAPDGLGEDGPDSIWHQYEGNRREWMLYWHRYTDEWLRVLDSSSHPDIDYWIRCLETDQSGVFEV